MVISANIVNATYTPEILLLSRWATLISLIIAILGFLFPKIIYFIYNAADRRQNKKEFAASKRKMDNIQATAEIKDKKISDSALADKLLTQIDALVDVTEKIPNTENKDKFSTLIKNIYRDIKNDRQLSEFISSNDKIIESDIFTHKQKISLFRDIKIIRLILEENIPNNRVTSDIRFLFDDLEESLVNYSEKKS